MVKVSKCAILAAPYCELHVGGGFADPPPPCHFFENFEKTVRLSAPIVRENYF